MSRELSLLPALVVADILVAMLLRAAGVPDPWYGFLGAFFGTVLVMVAAGRLRARRRRDD